MHILFHYVEPCPTPILWKVMTYSGFAYLYHVLPSCFLSTRDIVVVMLLCVISCAGICGGDICHGSYGNFTGRCNLSQILTTLDISEASSLGTTAVGFVRDARFDARDPC